MADPAEGPWTVFQNAAPAPVEDGPWVIAQQQEILNQPQPNAPHGVINAIIAGIQSSASGLILRGKKPDTALAEDAPWYERTAANVAGTVADLPEMIVGGAGGGAVAGPIGATAGAFAAPQALREALMTAYAQGGANSWEDVWAITKSALAGGTKGAVIGAATGGAGRFVGTLGGGLAARTGAEIATMTTAGSALEGRMPTAQDFVDAAIVVGGLRVATTVAGRLRNIYAKTGAPPEEVALQSLKDPELKAQINASDEIPAAFKPIAAEENVKAAVPDPKDRATAVQFAQSPFKPIDQIPGDPAKPTEVNYNYINSSEDVAGALSRLSQLYEPSIQAQRRGEVSNVQTMQEAKTSLADILGTTGERVPGGAANATELYARKQLAVGAAEEVVRQGKALADLGEKATPEQVTQFLAMVERSSMILSEFLGARAETGRALQILKSTSRLSVKFEEMQKTIDQYGGTEGALKLAKIIGETDNPAAALAAAKKATTPTLLEKIIEVWKASILTGPTTHMANVSGNIIGMGFLPFERYVAAGIGAVRGGSERVTFTEAHALTNGMFNGVMDGLKMAGAVMRDEAPMSPKLDQPRGSIGGAVGEAIRIPFRALSAEDAFFRTVAERGEANAFATRQAYAEKLIPGTREFNARVVDLVQNPDEAMLKYIKDAGDVVVYTSKLGTMGTHLQLAVRGTPLEFVLPFIKTPANLLKWAAERLPGVNLLMANVRDDLSNRHGEVARDLAMARMVVGGVVATTVLTAMESGNLTGGGIADPEKRRAKMAAGWQPYSIKFGDTYYNYARIDPLGRLLATVADIAEISQAVGLDAHDKINLGGVMVAAIGNATISQTYLSGLASAIGALTDPQRYGDKILDQYAASLVPSIIGQTAAAMDPKAREVNGVLDAIQARIPIWREQLLPKINPLTGEPIKPERLFPLAPVITTKATEDKVLSEAARLGVSLPVAPKKVHLGRGVGKLGDVKIAPEARNAYTETQGKFAHQLLEQIVNTPAWDGMPDLVKESIYSKILAGARRQAALTALPPEARIIEAVRIANEVQQQLNQ